MALRAREGVHHLHLVEHPLVLRVGLDPAVYVSPDMVAAGAVVHPAGALSVAKPILRLWAYTAATLGLKLPIVRVVVPRLDLLAP